MRVRAVELVNGEIRLIVPPTGMASAPAAFLADEQAKDAATASRPYVDVDTSALPDRTERARWRLRDGAVVADPSVPAPADPTAAADGALFVALDEIQQEIAASAGDLARLQQAVAKIPDQLRAWMAARPGVYAPTEPA